MAPMKLRNRLLTLTLVLAVLGLAGYAAARILLPQVLTAWVAGSQFERVKWPRQTEPLQSAKSIPNGSGFS